MDWLFVFQQHALAGSRLFPAPGTGEPGEGQSLQGHKAPVLKHQNTEDKRHGQYSTEGIWENEYVTGMVHRHRVQR